MKVRRKNISVTVPAGLWAKVSRYSEESFDSRSGIVETALKEFFEKRKRAEKKQEKLS